MKISKEVTKALKLDSGGKGNAHGYAGFTIELQSSKIQQHTTMKQMCKNVQLSIGYV